MARRRKKPDTEVLRKIGEEVLNRGWDVVRTSAVKAVAGKGFYSAYAKGPENMNRLVDQIRELDPEKFGHLRYVPIPRKKSAHTHLSDKEEAIIEDVLLELTDENNELPKGAFKEVHRRLKEAGFDRSYSSTHYHARTIWDGQYPYYDGIMPNRLLNPNGNGVRKLLASRLDQVEEEKPGDLEKIVGTDEGKKKRTQFMKYAPRGHQALVAYMMDPENYKRLLGNNVKLESVDFNEENTDPELYRAFRERVEGLRGRLEEGEEEVTDFIDNWLRADMTFRRNSGEWMVVEVKQNAVNKPTFRNADKARQQIASYSAVLLDNVKMRNLKILNGQEEGELFKEDVEGALVAYTIELDLQKHLSLRPGRRAIEVPKQEVLEYIKQYIESNHGIAQNQQAETPVEVNESPQTQPLAEVQEPLKNLQPAREAVAIDPSDHVGISRYSAKKLEKQIAEDHRAQGHEVGLVDPTLRLNGYIGAIAYRGNLYLVKEGSNRGKHLMRMSTRNKSLAETIIEPAFFDPSSLHEI